MNSLKKELVIVTASVSIFFASCKKKELTLAEQEQQVQTGTSLVRKDANFPEGVLQFKSPSDLEAFYNNIEEDPNYALKVTTGFETFRAYFDKYMASQKSKPVSEDVDSLEFINDAKSLMLPIEDLSGIVNKDMQFIVGDSLYQFTRIGLFRVNLENLSDYTKFYKENVNNLFFNSNYTKTPNETLIGGNEYLVQPGVTRTPMSAGNVFSPASLEYMDDKGGWSSAGSPPDNTFATATVGEGFNKDVAIPFRDNLGKRRFCFQTQYIKLFIFNKIDIKAKVQREKRFLGISYWGPSYADEIIVGCDNMCLHTDYVYPTPQEFNTIQRPDVKQFSNNYKIGNHVVKMLDININVRILGFRLNNSYVTRFLNDKFNSFIGGRYENAFKTMEQAVIDNLDPSYATRYADCTKRLSALREANTVKWVMGKTEKTKGYSHENTWTFDTNFGFGGSGTTYKYQMKAGSFFGRARFGNTWRSIRIIRE